MMAEMAEAIGRKYDAANYRKQFRDIQAAYVGTYVNPDSTLKVPTQTAHVLALAVGLLPDVRVKPVADHLAGMIAKNDHRMATGFIGTRPLPLVLSANGRHDLAVRLFQSRKFPSWGYEVVNGATTIWERWDSYTKADGFGRHNAAMNSFSHYTFGAVGEWMFRALAGIDTDGPGYKRILIRPGPPTPGSNPDHKPIDWVKAEYRSIRGPIAVRWRRTADRFDLDVAIPANTTATVVIPAARADDVTESGRPAVATEGVQVLRAEGDRVWLAVGSGTYRFAARVK
jgi:alpha-L-rhamnosidase